MTEGISDIAGKCFLYTKLSREKILAMLNSTQLRVLSKISANEIPSVLPRGGGGGGHLGI